MREKRPEFFLIHTVSCFAKILIVIILFTSFSGCTAMTIGKDEISELSFAPDGKKVVFDRCQMNFQRKGCQIQVYDLETGELAAYQSPKGERWTMGKYSDDGGRITFSVIPVKPEGGLDLSEMQIAVMDADGKNFRKVTTGQGAKLYPTFSHSGKKVLYARADFIRSSGRTPAADYDAWEINLETGEQKQLTFYSYYYMGYLSYFPDDERYLYYGTNPSPATYEKEIKNLMREGKVIAGIVVMKGTEVLPSPYKFAKGILPEKPLLSRDGDMMIFEKMYSGGKYYQYSADGNHRLVGLGGSVTAAAVSTDGKYLGIISADYIMQIFEVRDGSLHQCIALPENIPQRDYGPLRNKINEILISEPQRILNK